MKNLWHILGAGSVGGLFACHLSMAKQQVVLLLREEQSLANFKAVSPKLTEASHSFSPSLSGELANTPGQSINNLLIATKAPQTIEAFTAIQNRLASDCAIVILQNGMGVYEKLAALHPAENIYCALTTEGVYQQQRFQWIHAGRGKTLIGQHQSGAGQKPIETLFNIGLDCQWSDKIAHHQWKKLIINCAINGLTAIHGCSNGELIGNPELHTQMQKLCGEISLACKAIGEHDLAESVYSDAIEVIEATADNYSSTLQDIQQCRKTEIDYINGFFCEQMEALEIDCHLNRKLWKEIKELEFTQGCG